MDVSRRQMLIGSAAAGLGLLAGGALDGLQLSSAGASAPGWTRWTDHRGFGPLVPDPFGLLDLPAGFSYAVVSRAGAPLVGPQAGSVPGRPDGTASFAGPRGSTLLVNNHEQGDTADLPALAPPELTYDPGALGGTTTIALDGRNRRVGEYVSLAGTFNNCAGGMTPWGTWLTCEETEQRAGGQFEKDHGYVFEVDPRRPEVNRDPVPLTALGRFAHEAVVVDPVRGHLYLTEDASGPNGLLFRFTPHRRNALHSLRNGGTLEVLSVPGVADLSRFDRVGTTLPATWRRIPDPSGLVKGSVRKQFDYVDRTNRAVPLAVAGEGGAVTRSRKFEGLWWGNDRAYIVCSFARVDSSSDWSEAAHDGQVWSYDPRHGRLRLEAFFPVNPDPDGDTAEQPDGPDNITVNPWGGLVLAEDGLGTQHLVAVSERGTPSVFARNAVSGSEFTGVNFSPDRRTLFANIQDDGYVFAIIGPFQRS